MSEGTFVLVLALGAGLLAVWTHARFPGLAPERLGRALLHVGAAMLALKALPVALDSGLSLYLALFAGALPALTYALLAALWMLRLAQSALGLQR